MILDGIYNHWKDVIQDNCEYKGKVHALRWQISSKNKEQLVNTYFLLVIPYIKGGNIFWTCVEDNIIQEKYKYKLNRLY